MAWDNTTDANLLRIQRLQNRAARIVANNFNYEVPSLLIIKDFNLQTVQERKDFLIGTMMYKCLTGTAPDYLGDHLTFKRDMREQHTRQASHETLHVPYAQTQYFQRSFAVAGPVLWNSLPEHVRHAETRSSFKSSYKRHIQSLRTEN